jgi:hypothetical protein
MKKIMMVCAAIVFGFAAFAQEPPPPPASVTETLSGTVKNKYVSPYDLAQAGGIGTVNSYYYGTVAVAISATNIPVGGTATANVTGTSNVVIVLGIPVGATGAVGPAGPAGTPGATGATGSTGETGANGATGARGLSGSNGTNAAVYTHTFGGIGVTNQVWAHGLGYAPVVVNAMLVCTNADGGMAIGERINTANLANVHYAVPYFNIGTDATSLREGAFDTLATDCRFGWKGAYQTPTSWDDFTIIVVYQ